MADVLSRLPASDTINPAISESSTSPSTSTSVKVSVSTATGFKDDHQLEHRTNHKDDHNDEHNDKGGHQSESTNKDSDPGAAVAKVRLLSAPNNPINPFPWPLRAPPSKISNERNEDTDSLNDSSPKGSFSDDSSSAVSTKRFTCPQCPQAFTRMHNLKSHILTHTQERPFTCDLCSSKFRRINDLKRHSKLHTGERPYPCRVCGRKFARADALMRHVKRSVKCTGGDAPVGSPSPVSPSLNLLTHTIVSGANSVSISSLTSSSNDSPAQVHGSTPAPPRETEQDRFQASIQSMPQVSRLVSQTPPMLSYPPLMTHEAARPGSLLPPIRDRAQLMSPDGRSLPPLVDAKMSTTMNSTAMNSTTMISTSSSSGGSGSTNTSSSGPVSATFSTSSTVPSVSDRQTPSLWEGKPTASHPHGNEEELLTLIRGMDARMRTLEERLARTEGRLSSTEEKLIRVLEEKYGSRS